MKNMTTLLAALLFTVLSFAQTGLYQTIENNGATTQYKEFYAVSKGETPGTTKISGDRYWVTASVTTLESGEKIGFTLVKVDGSGNLMSVDELGRYDRAVGFPNVSYIYHEQENDGYIAVGDYIMELNNISSDGLSFESIEAVYVKKQADEKSEAAEGEKKKGGKFGAALKGVAMKSVGLGPDGAVSKELKKASSEDLHQIALDYLKAMKAKQNAYALSASDKADMAAIVKTREEKYAKIKEANDAYWASPEGQALYASYGNNSNSPSHYTIKNTTGKTVQVGVNGGATYLANGSTKTISCGSPIYIMELNGNSLEQSSLISDGKNVCGKTITF